MALDWCHGHAWLGRVSTTGVRAMRIVVSDHVKFAHVVSHIASVLQYWHALINVMGYSIREADPPLRTSCLCALSTCSIPHRSDRCAHCRS
jgi:hypothetical protein